jgi:hypothetical protein
LLRNSFWRFDRGLIEVFNLFREHPSLIALSGCALLSVAVPPSFGRNAPGRYVIIRTDFAPPKLVATTWRKVADSEVLLSDDYLPENHFHGATAWSRRTLRQAHHTL